MKFIECGKIINTHGVKGCVKAEAWCDSPEILANLPSVYMSENGQMKERKIENASLFKQFVLLTLEGICDLDAAMKLKNQTLYADRKDIPLEEGDYFICDLKGLPVLDFDTGKTYGKLIDVLNVGASDIYLIDTPKGEVMIPAVSEFIRDIDLEKGIAVQPIPGMFD